MAQSGRLADTPADVQMCEPWTLISLHGISIAVRSPLYRNDPIEPAFCGFSAISER